MSIIQGTAKSGGATAGGVYDYPIEQSLRFDGSSYLSRTFGSGDQQTWTWSSWIKRGNISNTSGSGAASELDIFGSGINVNSGNGVCSLGITNNINLHVWQYLSGAQFDVATTQVFRDFSAWYHIIISVNTSLSGTTDRIKMYINGGLVADFGTTSYPSQNYNTGINSTDVHNIGRRPDGQNYWNGYLANIHFIDGQALDASSFGELVSGVWVPKEYTGTYGTNGFHLDFADPNDIGNDVSGNNNHWTVN